MTLWMKFVEFLNVFIFAPELRGGRVRAGGRGPRGGATPSPCRCSLYVPPHGETSFSRGCGEFQMHTYERTYGSHARGT